MDQFVREFYARRRREIRSDLRRDVGDGETISGKKAPGSQFGIEISREGEGARPVQFDQFGICGFSISTMAGWLWRKASAIGKKKLQFGAALPHFHARLFERIAPEQRRIGLDLLEIAADRHGFSK